MKSIRSIKKAVEIVGGPASMARLLNVTPPAVYQWISGVRRVPVKRCPQIEQATKGKVKCEQLRPDVDWQVLRGPGG